MKSLGYLILLLFIVSGPLFAHEKRAVGDYEFVVGFVNEPAFSGQMNGVDLRVSKSGEPVEGLEKTLKVAVSYGDQTESLPLEFNRKYKDPGKYAAYFLPTKAGQYTFMIEGMIGEDMIREVFISGEKFHNMIDSNTLKWPRD